MTVGQLKALLDDLGDDDLPVCMFHRGDMDGPDSVFYCTGYRIHTKEVYDWGSNKLNTYKPVTFVELEYGMEKKREL